MYVSGEQRIQREHENCPEKARAGVGRLPQTECVKSRMHGMRFTQRSLVNEHANGPKTTQTNARLKGTNDVLLSWEAKGRSLLRNGLPLRLPQEPSVFAVVAPKLC